jgi:hypothetical protein
MTKDDCSFDGLLQLAYIPWPGIAQEQLYGPRGNADDLLPELLPIDI